MSQDTIQKLKEAEQKIQDARENPGNQYHGLNAALDGIKAIIGHLLTKEEGPQKKKKSSTKTVPVNTEVGC